MRCQSMSAGCSQSDCTHLKSHCSCSDLPVMAWRSSIMIQLSSSISHVLIQRPAMSTSSSVRSLSRSATQALLAGCTRLQTRTCQQNESGHDDLRLKAPAHPHDVCTESRVEMTDVPLCTTRNTDIVSHTARTILHQRQLTSRSSSIVRCPGQESLDMLLRIFGFDDRFHRNSTDTWLAASFAAAFADVLPLRLLICCRCCFPSCFHCLCSCFCCCFASAFADLLLLLLSSCFHCFCSCFCSCFAAPFADLLLLLFSSCFYSFVAAFATFPAWLLASSPKSGSRPLCSCARAFPSSVCVKLREYFLHRNPPDRRAPDRLPWIALPRTALRGTTKNLVFLPLLLKNSLFLFSIGVFFKFLSLSFSWSLLVECWCRLRAWTALKYQFDSEL